MSSSISHPHPDLSRLDRAWWLPSGGRGNGLDDVGWAPIMDAYAPMVEPLLQALRGDGIPGYAAPALPVASQRVRPDARRRYRIWVGTSCYSRAADTLMRVIPGLADHRPLGDPARTEGVATERTERDQVRDD